MQNINLKVARVRRLWTQKQIAKEIGISSSAYQQIECGKKEPSMKTAKKISLLLGLSIDDLFFSESEKNNHIRIGGN